MGCFRAFRMCRFIFAAVIRDWDRSCLGECRRSLRAKASRRVRDGSGRRELAAWIASDDNPLTARVIVNRVWQSHFGDGLVRTPNNFGLLSEPPSHPAMLDWLAARFIDDGWSLKTLHRRIVLSATYRQDGGRKSKSDKALLDDPDNRWLARFAPHRLEAEAIRDAMLSVTGTLDKATGGPASDDIAILRRSLYVQTARWDRSNFATLFDAANPDASDEKRSVSTVAPQSLFMLNNSFTLSTGHTVCGTSDSRCSDRFGRRRRLADSTCLASAVQSRTLRRRDTHCAAACGR